MGLTGMVLWCESESESNIASRWTRNATVKPNTTVINDASKREPESLYSNPKTSFLCLNKSVGKGIDCHADQYAVSMYDTQGGECEESIIHWQQKPILDLEPIIRIPKLGINAVAKCPQELN